MRIKKYILGLALLVITVTCGSFAFAADEPAIKPTCDFSWTFYSKYVWRGFELSKDSLVMFPSITVGLDTQKWGSLDFNVWGDFDTDYEGVGVTGNNDSAWWETDWVVTYNNAFCLTEATKLNWSLGWIYYDTDSGDDEEVFMVFGLENEALNKIISPEVSVWRGIEWGDSWYINLSASHSFAIDQVAKGWTFDVGGWVAFYDIDNANYSEWHDATVWAGLTIPVNDWLSLTPSLNYSFPLSGDSEDFIEAASFDGNDSDWVYGGLAVNISF